MSTDTLHSGKNKRLVPVLRFKEFDGEWSNFKIGDIATKVGSGSTPSGGNQVYQSYGVPFIRSQNVANNKLDLDDTHISEEINSKMNGSIVKPNDILLNITGASIGRTCVVPNNFERGNVNQHVCIIRLKDQFAPRFLQPFLSSQKGQKLVYEGQTGSGREGLNFKSIRLFKLRIPSLPEQKKIATFLSTIDKKIQQLTRKKTLLEVYKKGLMQQLFSGALRFKPAPQGSGHEEGKDYPDWEVKRLGDFLIPTIREVVKPKNNFLAIGIRSHCKGTFQKPDFDPNKIAMEKLFEVKENDLIVNITFAWEGAIAKVKGEDEGGLVSHRFPTYIFNRDIALHEYFQFVIIQRRFRFQLVLISPGGAGRNRVMSKKEFLKIKLKMPSVLEQQKIANFLSSIDTKIESVNNQITKTQTFKKGLLQQMFV